METKMRQVTFQVEERDFKKIEEECAKQGRTKASLIRFIVLSKIGDKNAGSD